MAVRLVSTSFTLNDNKPSPSPSPTASSLIGGDLSFESLINVRWKLFTLDTLLFR